MTTETIELALFVVFALAAFTFVMCGALRAQVTDLNDLLEVQDDRAHIHHHHLTEIYAELESLWDAVGDLTDDTDPDDLEVPHVCDTDRDTMTAITTPIERV